MTITNLKDNMIRLFLICRTLLSYILCFFVALFFFAPVIFLIAILPARLRYSHWLFALINVMYKGTMSAMMLPITITGKEHIPRMPAIFIANHESALDIPMLGSLLNGTPHMWYVLDRFSRVPLLGFFVRRMCVTVDQTSSTKSSEALRQGLRLVEKNNIHTLIFPEGGRYNDGKIHAFFKGFAILAKKTRRPVVPVLLYNLGKVYPPRSFFIHTYPVRVLIGKPFLFKDTETIEEFTDRVYAWFIENN